MTAPSEGIDTPAVSRRSSRSISETLGFGLGIAGATAVAMLVRDWWGQYLYSGVLGSSNVHSSYNLAKLLLLLSLVVAVFGWWLTSQDFLQRSVVLTLTKTVGAVGCVLAGVGFVHLISAKVPGMLGMSVPSYRTAWAPWSFYLKYDALPVVVAFALAGIGFAIVRRIDRPKG